MKLDIPSSDIKGYLTNICDNFNLTNLVNNKTSCTKTYDGTSIDVIMTTRQLCFHDNSVLETGLSEYHKLIMTFLKSRFQRLPSKSNFYRSYKNFESNNFLEDLKNIPFDNIMKEPSPYEKKYRLKKQNWPECLVLCWSEIME